MITDYILSTDDVRAALGLSTHDIEDNTILLPIFDLRLQEGLIKVHPNLPTLITQYKLIDEEHQLDPLQPPLTPLESRIWNVARVYATYLAAYIIAPTLPIFALKKETDGRSAGERMTNAFDHVMDYLSGTLSGLESGLQDLLEENGEEIIRIPLAYYTIGVGLAVDPVTGE